MSELRLPDKWHLEAAQGWVALGDCVEANVELEKIAPALRTHPEVLEVRRHIYAKGKNWEACVDIAEAIIKLDPSQPDAWIHRSFALHELKRTAEARDNLLPVMTKFPTSATMHYNLACYECQLGNLYAAGDYLEKAFDISGSQEMKLKAREDPNLEPLWREHVITQSGQVCALPVNFSDEFRRKSLFFLALLFWAVASAGVAWRDNARMKVNFSDSGLAGAGILLIVGLFLVIIGLGRLGAVLLLAGVVGGAVALCFQF